MELRWDSGTAYDFFASLHVLHHPDRFGLRGAWAAGVRSRLPADDRKVLEQAEKAFFIPLNWIYHLPAPKNVQTVLQTLASMPASERLPALTFSHAISEEMRTLLLEVGQRGRWGEQDLSALRAMRKARDWNAARETLEAILNAWAKQEDFGEFLLRALTTYQEVFFAEEVGRIAPALEEAIVKAQVLARAMPWPQLLENLSQGVRFPAELEADTLILVPSFWTAPLVVFQEIQPQTWLFLFGARPVDASLVPGESVPDTMLRALKALADPTRLRILRYLSHEPMTSSELARKLRLRAPTVVHHLNILRLAGLVFLSVDVANRRSDRCYMARPEMVQQTFALLGTFLAGSESE
ncbi:MAG: ArsR family transcriptional regulator [Anaerolineae bacterium]|nr:MAG: ArsR family transcriptional regulator [Anaerolineae bacterium]